MTMDDDLQGEELSQKIKDQYNIKQSTRNFDPVGGTYNQ